MKNTLRVRINQKKIVVLLLSVLFLISHPSSGAAEEKPSFFGIKKFLKKSAPANLSEKKVINKKPALANLSEKESANKVDNSEPSDSKSIEDRPALPNEKAIIPKESIKLPPSPFKILPWKAPTLPTNLPASVPKNPNDLIPHRVPRPPARIPLDPNASQSKQIPPVPNKKKL